MNYKIKIKLGNKLNVNYWRPCKQWRIFARLDVLLDKLVE